MYEPAIQQWVATAIPEYPDAINGRLIIQQRVDDQWVKLASQRVHGEAGSVLVHAPKGDDLRAIFKDASGAVRGRSTSRKWDR